MKKHLPIFVVLLLTLSGCIDKVELENRGFVVSLGIDRGENIPFAVSMAIPDVQSLASGSDGGDKNNKYVKSSEGETISQAMWQADSYSSQKLYYGHSKICVISEDILKDEKLFREVLDTLERNKEISRKLLILATDKSSKDVLDAKSAGEPMVGMYVSNFFKNNAGTASVAFRHDLGELISELRFSQNAVLPKIEIEEDEVKFSGAAVIKDYTLVGWMDDEQTRGYLWMKNSGVGSQITVDAFGGSVPLKITKMKSRISFEGEDGNNLTVVITIKGEGEIDGFLFDSKALYNSDNIDLLKQGYESEIEDEIYQIMDLFQNELGVDALKFLQELRKYNYPIYLEVKDNWEDAFKNIEVVAKAEVEITNTGAVK